MKGYFVSWRTVLVRDARLVLVGKRSKFTLWASVASTVTGGGAIYEDTAACQADGPVETNLHVWVGGILSLWAVEADAVRSHVCSVNILAWRAWGPGSATDLVPRICKGPKRAFDA